MQHALRSVFFVTYVPHPPMSIYFFLFLLLFFSLAQADSITLVWSMCLGRAAQHHPWLWGILLTLLLLLPARWWSKGRCARGH